MSLIPTTLKLFSVFALTTGLACTLFGLTALPYETKSAAIPITPLSHQNPSPTNGHASTNTNTNTKTDDAPTPTPTPAQPTPYNQALILADSQLRYLGAIWTLYGVILYYCALDLTSSARKDVLAMLGAGMMWGGFGRGLGAWLYGFPQGPWVVFTLAEVVAPVGVGVWGLGRWW